MLGFGQLAITADNKLGLSFFLRSAIPGLFLIYFQLHLISIGRKNVSLGKKIDFFQLCFLPFDEKKFFSSFLISFDRFFSF